MRRPWGALLLLLLLLPATGAPLFESAPERPEDAVLPAKLLLSFLPTIVEGSIEESRRDLSPDRALHVVSLWEKIDREIQALSSPPSGSYSDLAWLSLNFTHDVFVAVRGVPENVSVVEREICKEEGERSVEPIRRSLLNLQVSAALLRALEKEVPPYVDPTNLQLSAQDLSNYTSESTIRFRSCLPEELTLTLVPERTYPTGRVRAVVLSPRVGKVLLDLGDLGAPIVLQTSDLGSAVYEFSVPELAPLGPRTIQARLEELHDKKTLFVEKAPSTLRVEGPQRALPLENLSFSIRVLTPLPRFVGEGPVIVETPWGTERVPLDRASGALQGRSPSAPGRYLLKFSYPGSDRVLPSDLLWTLVVLPPTPGKTSPPESNPTSQPPAPTPLSPPNPSPLSGSIFPYWIFLLLFLLLLLLYILKRRRSKVESEPHVGDLPTLELPPATPSPPRGVLELFLYLYRWLRSLGRVRRSSTLREAFRNSPDSLRSLLPRVEEIRYGGLEETLEVPESVQREGVRWVGVDR